MILMFLYIWRRSYKCPGLAPGDPEDHGWVH